MVPKKHVGHKRHLETEEEESDDEIMVEEATTSEDDQEMEMLGAWAKDDQQLHKGATKRHEEEEYTELGEGHRNQAGADNKLGRAI